MFRSPEQSFVCITQPLCSYKIDGFHEGEICNVVFCAKIQCNWYVVINVLEDAASIFTTVLDLQNLLNWRQPDNEL
jgi:hypothetical protein